MLGLIFGNLIKKMQNSTMKVSQDFVKSSGQEIERLFDEKLYPLADKLDYIAQKRLEESAQEIEALEIKTKADIEIILNTASDKIRENLREIDLIRQETIKSVQKTSGEIDTYLENRINQMSLAVMEALQYTQLSTSQMLSQINQLEDQIFQDGNDLIDRVEEVIDKTLEQVRMELKRYLGNSLPGVFDQCKRRLNLQWKSAHKISDIELYRLAECYELSKLNENTPIHKIEEIYGQLQLNAARMAVLVKTAPALKKIAVADWIKYGILAQFWSDTKEFYEFKFPMLEDKNNEQLIKGMEN